MKVTRSQKISLAVLSAAIIAYIADARSASSPLQSEVRAADATAVMSASMVLPLESTSPASAAPVSFSTLTDRLQSFSPAINASSVIRDIFFIPAAFGADRDILLAKSTPRSELFVRSHRLKAIIASASGGQAVVDDQLLQVGQVIDGFRLLSISDLGADFGDGHAYAQLHIQEQPLSPSQTPNAR